MDWDIQTINYFELTIFYPNSTETDCCPPLIIYIDFNNRDNVRTSNPMISYLMHWDKVEIGPVSLIDVKIRLSTLK
jgi:hypothetical protein